MKAKSAALRLRPDLIHKRIQSGGTMVWVIKDPLARTYVHFTEQEHTMLCLADGKRSLTQLCSDAAALFVPQHLPATNVVQFFAEANAKGLLIAAKLPSSAKTTSRWSNPLAIRLPGIDPTPWLGYLDPIARVLFSPFAIVAGIAVMLVAVSMAVSRWSVFAENLSTAAGRFDLWVVLVLAIAMTKITHELAHAMVCRKLGGQCTEIGVMFLVGIPCLYCDVSDAWMIPRPWKRMLVSAAGMIAELMIAAIATWVWVFTIDGPLRDVCVTVMVVCSASTVLFNGNPLMRYDGYYILSDAIGIPNLAGRANALANDRLRNFLWGVAPVYSSSVDDAGARSIGLIAYFIASVVYRWMVYSALATVFYAWAKSHGGGDLALIVIGSLLMSFLVRGFPRWFKKPCTQSRSSDFFSTRPGLALAGLSALLVAGAFVPLPRSVTAPSITQPQSAETLVVTLPGRVQNAVRGGTVVQPGQVVCSLVDDDAAQHRLSMTTRRDQLVSTLASLQNRRGIDSDAASTIPATRRALDETEKQIKLVDRELDRRSIRATVRGVAFDPERMAMSPVRAEDSQFWSGTPLDLDNRGARLDEGTTICVIGDEVERDAIAYIRQQDVELVRVGQPVAILVADRPRGSVRGVIMEVATSPANEIPEGLIRSGRISDKAIDVLRSPYYQARVRIDHQATPLSVRMIATVQVEVESASAWIRLRRWFSNAF
ncbi:Peptidase family M50 [Rubripirellula tenax]|uniref:Peptidase family M50 n=1 Tax=Rubripirellula tenax TaxID=2528015 RepID=A0A5C6F0K8_9BACT|nr:Peptidase family M50 [Rubripirellula tenax]